MSTKETLLEQFNTCFETNGWFVAVKNAIAGISPEQAAWKPADAGNSIWEVLSHLNYYNNAYLERFQGREFEYEIADNDATFTQSASEEGWHNEVRKFEQIMNGWYSALKAADESRFDELAPPYNDHSWAWIIASINSHTAHHGGQIVLLRKLQDSWTQLKAFLERLSKQNKFCCARPQILAQLS
jgi:uncharacterized damage-inducible protein DinB